VINRLLQWIKNNKLTALLLVIVFFMLFGNPVRYLGTYSKRSSINSPNGITGFMESDSYSGTSKGISLPSAGFSGNYNSAPVTPRLDVQDRKVVTNSDLSLLVQDVRSSIDQVEEQVRSKNGYIVRSYMASPEGGESGTVELRVPKEELDSILVFLRGMSVKVVYENIYGKDITDQYLDIEARLSTLNEVKTRYEEIMDRATDVDQILNVQQRIFSVQDQIDALKGQLNYMNATTFITVHMSTDELALPYTPEEFWRPQVVFKQAVRSLISTMRGIGSLVIWVGVYAVVWVPFIVLVVLIKKINQRRQNQIRS
jgi:hypothetical protein